MQGASQDCEDQFTGHLADQFFFGPLPGRLAETDRLLEAPQVIAAGHAPRQMLLQPGSLLGGQFPRQVFAQLLKRSRHVMVWTGSAAVHALTPSNLDAMVGRLVTDWPKF